MSNQSDTPSLLGEALLTAIRDAVRDAIRETGLEANQNELLEPEELALKLKVPISWVYEQSRQGNIPTHRIGRYIRFHLREVIESQKKNNGTR